MQQEASPTTDRSDLFALMKPNSGFADSLTLLLLDFGSTVAPLGAAKVDMTLFGCH
jgi:hypothetical protein